MCFSPLNLKEMILNTLDINQQDSCNSEPQIWATCICLCDVGFIKASLSESTGLFFTLRWEMSHHSRYSPVAVCPLSHIQPGASHRGHCFSLHHLPVDMCRASVSLRFSTRGKSVHRKYECFSAKSGRVPCHTLPRWRDPVFGCQSERLVAGMLIWV